MAKKNLLTWARFKTIECVKFDFGSSGLLSYQISAHCETETIRGEYTKAIFVPFI